MAFSRLAGQALVAVGLILPFTCTVYAAPPLLFTLESADPGRTHISVPVRAEGGLAASPTRGQLREKWSVRPGESVSAKTRPADRLVELYQASGGTQATLLCAVHVRYFRDKNNAWQPHYAMLDEPLITRRGEKWLPASALRGNAALVVLTSSTLPNAEGFYPALEFGLSLGTTPIDYWSVR